MLLTFRKAHIFLKLSKLSPNSRQKYFWFDNRYLRDHVTTDLNIYCTVFPGVIFRFLGEFSMHIKPFQPSNGLLVLKTAFRYDHSKQYFGHFT